MVHQYESLPKVFPEHRFVAGRTRFFSVSGEKFEKSGPLTLENLTNVVRPAANPCPGTLLVGSVRLLGTVVTRPVQHVNINASTLATSVWDGVCLVPSGASKKSTSFAPVFTMTRRPVASQSMCVT